MNIKYVLCAVALFCGAGLNACRMEEYTWEKFPRTLEEQVARLSRDEIYRKNKEKECLAELRYCVLACHRIQDGVPSRTYDNAWANALTKCYSICQKNVLPGLTSVLTGEIELKEKRLKLEQETKAATKDIHGE